MGEAQDTFYAVHIVVRHLDDEICLRVGPFFYKDVAERWIIQFDEYALGAYHRDLYRRGAVVKSYDVEESSFYGIRNIPYDANPRTLGGTPLSTIQKVLGEIEQKRSLIGR